MTRNILAVVLSLVLLSACNLPRASNIGGPTLDPAAATAAQETQVAGALAAALAAAVTDTLSFTLTASETPSITPTFTLEIPRVSVSVDTNCRSGPGSVYDILGYLFVGQTAEVVGKSWNADNWIIKLPSNPAVTCWLWGYYATVVGDSSSLPIIQPPPTPTPLPTATATDTPMPVFMVTAVSVGVDRSSHSGPCPYRATWSGKITTTGAGTVKYDWETASIGGFSPSGVRTLVFDAAGTRDTATTWYQTPTTGTIRARIHVIEPNDVYSSEVAVSITCTP